MWGFIGQAGEPLNLRTFFKNLHGGHIHGVFEQGIIIIVCMVGIIHGIEEAFPLGRDIFQSAQILFDLPKEQFMFHFEKIKFRKRW